MCKRAFLFNGIGAKPEKLMANLKPELKDKVMSYADKEFRRLNLGHSIDTLSGYDRKVGEWLLSLICDRVVFEYYISLGITPDIGAGYSSGIVSISACFGALSHEFAHEIIMMNRSIMKNLVNHNEHLDMGVIIGLNYTDVYDIYKNEFTKDDIVIGSANSFICTMISGKEDAVSRVLEMCLEEGAIKAVKFGMGIGYHHPIMAKYSQEYIDFCAKAEYNNPLYPVISVFDNRIMRTGKEILRENQMNVITPIRWDLAIKELERIGVTEFYDISADCAVKKITRVNKSKCKIYTLKDI